MVRIRLECSACLPPPPEKDLEWSDRGVDGSYRFVNRIWRLVTDHIAEITKVPAYGGKDSLPDRLKAVHRKTHQTIKKVTGDIENRFHFNTGISAVMELVNEVTQFLNSKEKKDDTAWSIIRESIETSVVLLSPVVPHITEEMWEMLGHDECLITVPWPEYREDALEVENRLVVLQVNGKVRSRIEVPVSYGEDEIEAKALADERIKHFIDGKPVRKVIVVRKKLVNVVV